MSEDAFRAARMAQSAADDMLQAARNMEGTLEQLRMLWERTIQPDLTNLIDRIQPTRGETP